MPFKQTVAPTPGKPLRLWPGVLAAVLLVLLRFVVPLVVGPDAMMFGLPVLIVAVGSGIFGAVAIVVWWVFISRAPWSERLGAIAVMIVALFVTSRVIHQSIANGMMGMMFPIFATPVLSLAFVAWAVATRTLPSGPRRISMVATILLACGLFTVLRTGGITGDGNSDLHLRWTKTPEERLLAQGGDEPKALPPAPAAVATPEREPAAQAGSAPAALNATPAAMKVPDKLRVAQEDVGRAALPPVRAAATMGAAWPGFRGPNRDDVVHGVRINTDWSKSPPVELWRRPVGPGWSSFAVDGDVLYTQEQRGENEVVAAYRVTTGAPVWQHRDPVRFWESNGGAGPRGTPTLSNGRVYTFGATGILNALDAGDGAVVWSRNVASDIGKQVPTWGFASSPLAIDDVVVVAATGTLVAYDPITGKPRWSGPTHRGGYTSPHRLTIDGVAQILLLTADGAASVAPADGKLLWEHAWPGVPIVQPARTADGDILISTGDTAGAIGIRRIAPVHGPGGWTVEERWTSTGLKPYFNDFVVHKGHAFGFDGSILACIDIEDGRRTWKGGRYGHGQLLLLPDEDVLLVLSEEGELALVEASPDQFRELARFPALEGKTWNHPVLIGNVLLVRNDHEMVAFRLASPAADTTSH
jgi:outer membrane protein assembly factor BamB